MGSVGNSNCDSVADWWENALIYQIYPRSFKDSNGDIGHLKGIEQKLNYFTELGVEVLWLSRIFESPMGDIEYDISNFTEIDPVFGTMADFESLRKKMSDNNMKLILDFVPNHSSNKCEWFQKSIQKIDPYTDYYVWKDPRGLDGNNNPLPPNNWVNNFEESAWEFNKQRGQYYLHRFLKEQPDLNYRSKYLLEEMKDVLHFWLDKGVDGFKMDTVLHLMEHDDFLDECLISEAQANGRIKEVSLEHAFTANQPETYDVLAEFRKVLNFHAIKDGKTRVLLTEARAALYNVMQYYDTPKRSIAQIPFNLLLLDNLNYKSPASEFVHNIEMWINNLPAGNRPNWLVGNHDHLRITSRFAPEMTDGLLMLITLLPGIAIHHQGDELGLRDMKIRRDQVQDKSVSNKRDDYVEQQDRDSECNPIQCNSEIHADTEDYNWLPINADFDDTNLETQMKANRSHYHVFKDLVQLRKKDAFVKGDLEISENSEWVLTFKRSLKPSETYIIILNLENKRTYVNLKETFLNGTTDLSLQVVLPSVNSEYDKCEIISITDSEKGFSMRPNSALVLYGKL